MELLSSDINLPKLEEDILNFWNEQEIFKRQNEQNKECPEYSFYDGPPFANGLPHYGHLLAGTIKDTVTRYWVMSGYQIDRRFGWDCHGLPVEFEIEKRENLKGRVDIQKLGVEKFNKLCKDSVLHYASEWQRTITRLGRWVDWDNQYRTMDIEYMESVWWVFKELYEKGLIYEGFKVVPYSPRTSSVVSNFEANQNYKDIQDPSVVVKFKLEDSNRFVLIWTTTPWTLPSNLALAVGEEIDYVEVKDLASQETYILAKERLSFIYKDNKGQEPELYSIEKIFKGKELVGLIYEPLFSYFKNQKEKGAFKILATNFVSTTDGTGIVHQAPAFGEEDFKACLSHGISLVDPIDLDGCFNESVPDYKGLYFKDADPLIIKELKKRGLLLKSSTLVHSYPFDERTDTPLMYKAVPSWFVAVEKFSDKLVQNNEEINWVPSHIKKGRMGNWLLNAHDWSISRNRFWGTPLPVWICSKDGTHRDVFGSKIELEKKTGSTLDDLHKHVIDQIKFPCSTCSGTMTSVGLVFDCWFESGSMPYAQLHYPLENKKRFEENFPADFIAEGLDQTRGWFYTLLVLSTALFNKPAFKNVIVNGVILDESGKKMSKRHRNYTAPDLLMEKYGADSIRLYLLNSQLLRAENLVFTDKGVHDVTRAVLLPLVNAYSFLATYTNAEQWNPSAELLNEGFSSNHELDQWIDSRLQSLKVNVLEYMKDYKLYLVVPDAIAFIDDLTNWYIRLSRKRFWGSSEKKQEQEEAFKTLFLVLVDFLKILAPFAPFISEGLYRALVKDMKEMPDSIHLHQIPKVKTERINKTLEEDMNLLRSIVTQGRSLRQKHNLKVRQALPSITVITRNVNDKTTVEKYLDLLKQELNVKNVFFTTDEMNLIRPSLKPNFATLGKRLGPKLKDFRAHLAELNASSNGVWNTIHLLEKNGEILILDEKLSIEDFLIEREPLEGKLISTEKNITILLDTKLDEGLIQEGMSREIVNRIQTLRKDSGLNVTDRIKLQIIAPKDLIASVTQFESYICKETLCVHLETHVGGGDCMFKHTESYKIGDMSCIISLETHA